jgi:hypothetical protein
MVLPRLVKKVIGKIMLQGGGERWTHTFWDKWTCQMAKSDPEAQTKSSLSDCTWLERWVWVLILNPLETSNASRELGSFIIFSLFIYIHTHNFFFSPFSFFLSHFFFFSLFFFFYSPSTLNYIVPTSLATPPMLRRLHVLRKRGEFFVLR